MPCGHASGRGRGRLGWGRGGSRVAQPALFQEILAGRNHTAAALAMLCVRGDLAVAVRTFHDAKAFPVSSTKNTLVGPGVSYHRRTAVGWTLSGRGRFLLAMEPADSG